MRVSDIVERQYVHVAVRILHHSQVKGIYGKSSSTYLRDVNSSSSLSSFEFDASDVERKSSSKTLKSIIGRALF